MNLYPWQLDMLKKMSGFKKSELMVMTAGRRAGKSYWSGQAVDRLMKDLMSWPVEELVLSEGRVRGARYYCVEPVGGNWREMEAWCFKQFGDVGNNIGWAESENPVCHRWYMNNRKFWFRNEADRTMFILKWR
jgi:hypothetical protein